MGTKKKNLRYKGHVGPSYWIVVGVRSVINPVRHSTQEEACQEAIRLARLYPNQCFTVCEAEFKFKFFSEVEKVDVYQIDLDKDPFVNPVHLDSVQVIKAQEKIIGELKLLAVRQRKDINARRLKIETLNNKQLKDPTEYVIDR